jgi:exopolysaccharide production protein ExoZ
MSKTSSAQATTLADNVLPGSDGLPRHLDSLQWLRAIAALAVVYFHATLQVQHLSSQVDVKAIGATGVDIFFVLSGFIMWITTRTSTIGPANFLKKRIERIVPLYWILSALVSIIALIIPSLLKSTRFDLSHLIASMLFVPWPNPASTPGVSEYISPVIVPGWTLNMEMIFYVLFALCLPHKKLWRVIGITILIMALYIIGHVGTVLGSILSFYDNSVLFEFVFGVLLAAYLIPFLNLPAPLAWGVLGSSLIVLAFTEAASSDLPRAIKFGVPAFFAIAAAVNLERIRAVPRFQRLVKLGDASYSIYLSHIFVLAGLRMVIGFLHIVLSPWSEYGFIIAGVVTSAILGLLIHEFIEKPLSRFRVRIGRQDSAPTEVHHVRR